MARHDEGKQLLMCLDWWRLRYPLGMERLIRRQPVIHGLDKPESSLFEQRRLILRRRISVREVCPPIRRAESVIWAIVMLMVHADLGHHRIMHLPDDDGVSKI